MNQRKDDGSHVSKNEDAMKRLNNRCVIRNHLLATTFAKGLNNRFGSLGRTDGIAIDLDDSIAQLASIHESFQMKGTSWKLPLRKGRQPIKEGINDKAHIDAETDHGKERQILQESGAVSFGRLGGILRKELRTVDAAHESVFAIARQGRRYTLNMGRDAQEINLVRHLNDARAGIAGLLDGDFAFRKSFQEIARESIRMRHKGGNVEVLVALEPFKHLVAQSLDEQ
jgi:hypothetical protein